MNVCNAVIANSDNSLLVMNACFPFDRDICNLLLIVNAKSAYWGGILILVILGISVIQRSLYLSASFSI